MKPANVLLDESGEPKLADFGLVSSTVSEKLTATGTAIGSPHYVSPEQASGHPVTAASDVYSLGAVLYELLTGRTPFEADNVTALAIAHVEQPPVPPSARVEGIPEHLDAVVLSCLAKDPAARPRDADALADALEDERPATAWIPAPVEPEEAERRVRKRWLVPALLGASLLLVLAGAIYVSGRPDEVAEAGTQPSPGGAAPKAKGRGPQTSSPVPANASAAPVAVPVTTATPTPTPVPEEEATPTPAPEREVEEDDEPLWTPDPTQEPEPSEEPPEEPATTPAPGVP